MAKSTFGTVTALCGHEYRGSTNVPPWPHCRECMRAMRRRMYFENEERKRQLRERPPSPSYYISPAAREFVYERDAWICQLCLDPVEQGLPPTDIWSATLDHIVCRSWTTEPDHTAGNLRLAHRWCNSVRGDERHHSPHVLMPRPA